MLIRSGLGGVGVAILLSATAAAAPATQDQANAIRTALERYVGGGGDGQSPVAVTPEGDHYTIGIDVGRALRGLQAFDVNIESQPYTVSAAPLDGGTWHVTSTSVPRFTIKHGGTSSSVVVNGVNFDGVFDPKIPGFQTSSLSYDSMSIAGLSPNGDTQTREIERGKQTSVTTATGDGIANLQATQSNDGFSQDVNLDSPGPNGTGGKLSFKTASTTGTLAVDGLHTRALSDLWAFLVAHPSETAIKTSQAELKDLLRKALPLFDHWSQGGSAERLVVESPFGPFTAEHFTGRLKTTGLLADGTFESELGFAGATFPTGLLPPWADGLIPTTAAVRDSFSGFHLDAAARQVIDNLDLEEPQPVPPETVEKLKLLVGPLAEMVVTLAPSHLESKDLKVDLDGEMHLTQPVPDFRANVRVSGLDQALQNIQAKAAGDKSASQIIAVLLLAKGLGKAETDGSLSWAVTKSGSGEVLINGLALPGGGK